MARHNRPSAKEIFLQALEKPYEKRPAFVDEACRGDEALRSEVEELLRAHGSAADFLAHAPVNLNPGLVMSDAQGRCPVGAGETADRARTVNVHPRCSETPPEVPRRCDRGRGCDDAPRIQGTLYRRSPESATAAESRFFQDRLVLFCKGAFFVMAATFAARNLLQLVFAKASYLDWALRPTQGIHLALCVVLSAAWQYARHHGSWTALHTVDAAVTLLFCLAVSVAHHFTFMCAGIVLDRALFFATVILISRALVLPSTALRTFVLSLLAMLPVVAGSALMFSSVPNASVVLETGLTAQWSLVVVATSTVASSVIYTLRRRVHKAEQLGQYTLERKLGEGGMGVVYQARHAMLRRPTAIKLLRPTASDSASVARFEREVQLTSQLTHPNTIAIYDYGVTPDGVFYYAMEYLPGITLQRLVQQMGPLPEGRTIYILRQVAAALAEAHGIGLIHRDIKPANVILSERGGLYDFVKVLDFGLVKDIQTKHDLLQSEPGLLVGTPFYVSPEAIRNPETVDGRSDLYALGAVGYFLLTATTVFQCSSLIEACTHHLHTPVEPPSARLGRSVAPDLEMVLMRCLEKDPEQRPTNMAAFLAALESCADATRWSPEAARRWWLDHAELAAILAAGTGALEPLPAADTVALTARIEPTGRDSLR